MSNSEMNELLAKFMGYSKKVVKYREEIFNSSDESYWDWTEGELWVDERGHPLDEEWNELRFRIDWNWLMRVVDKIRSYPTLAQLNEGDISLDQFRTDRNSMFLEYSKRNSDKTVTGHSYNVYIPNASLPYCESFIEVVYKCCVDFVKFIGE